MSNALAIQRDVLSKVFSESNLEGCLLVTTSVYLDLERTQRWISELAPDVHWAAIPRPSPKGPIATGGVMYASREGAERLLRARYLSFGHLQDVAITKWLHSINIPWEAIPFAEASHNQDQATCILCAQPRAIAALCTRHPDRAKEAPIMAMLHGHHEVKR